VRPLDLPRPTSAKPIGPSLPVVWLLGALALVATLIAGCSGDSPTLNTSSTLAPATTSQQGNTAGSDANLSLVAEAAVNGDLEFRDAPSADAGIVATLPNPRPLATDPPVSIPLVMLVAATEADWVQVYLPIRPNGSTGWIPADQVTLTSHRWRIEAVLDDFTLRVFNDGEQVFETAIGVARDNAPTPGGLYYITELVQPPDPDTVYGTYAYGLSGFSETFETFNGGPGQLGLHGTNEPELIGQAVSAGCIRLTNDDINYLVEQLQIPLGVPVDIITSS